MHSLPSELQSLIIGQLQKPDYLNCITVCKAWYNMSIPCLYASIAIEDNKSIVPFLEAMTTHERCIDACKYIKELDVEIIPERYMMKQVKNGDKTSTHILDLMDLLIKCHNLQVLHVNADADIIQVLTVQGVKHLRKLERLTFNNTCMANAKKVFECLCRYNSTLVCLELDYASHVLDDYTTDMIVSCLTSFKFLKILIIQSPPRVYDGFNLIDIIFQCCPALTTLFYQDDEKVLMDITPRTQSLKEMHTGFKNIYHQDVYFIKNHFSQLTSLCLSIWEIPDAEVEIIDLLMSMEHLKIMTLCIADIPDNALKNALLTFWKHAPRITPRGVYGNTAKFSSEIDEATIQFSFFYNSLHNVRFLESCTDIENIHSRLAHEVLKEIGSSLQILDLTNAINFKDSNLGLSQINSLCPNLVRLDTGVYHKNHTDLPYYPQANLKELHICFSLVNDQLLENIEHLYPQLEFLELSGIEFGPDDNNRCILTLPNIPSLRRSLFRHGDELFDELHVVVIKKYTDGTTTTRYLSPIDNKVMTAAPDTPYEELFCKERPSLLFKTKTLQTFEFKKIRFDFNTVVIVDSSLR